MIDLHTHSSASDGILSPAELLILAVKKGIKHFALTDHNGIGGIAEAQKTAQSLNINFINGIELSCEGNTHIIGLFLKDFLYIEQKAKLRKSYMEESLKHNGFNLKDYKSLKDARDDFVADMIKSGKAFDKTDAIEHFLQPPFGLGEAINLIHASGGLAILAHPNRIQGVTSKALPDYIVKLIKHDLDGIEVYQSGQDDEFTKYILNIAEHNQLLISGGSDCHNPDGGLRELGFYGHAKNRKPIPIDLFYELEKHKNKYK